MAPYHREEAKESFLEGVSLAFNESTLSDLTVICEDREWKCHKLVLCNQSQWFLKACTSGFMETDAKSIRLEEDDPDAVHALPEYCYKMHYEVPSAYKTSPLTFHTLLYGAAEKYLVDRLLALALDNVMINSFTPNFDEDLAPAVSMVWSSNSDLGGSLRKALVDIVVANKEVLLSIKCPNKEFTKVLNGTALFAADVARAVTASFPPQLHQAEQDIVERTYYCPGGGWGNDKHLAFDGTLHPDVVYEHQCICIKQQAVRGSVWLEDSGMRCGRGLPPDRYE